YSSDREHITEIFGAVARSQLSEYLEKWVYSVGSHEEMLEERVGLRRMNEMRRNETTREGYRP
ncbi:MAG TPA: CoA transferase subunit A, partial [Dehalococcoidia bacterium]|nr:CoA transferase subunit A [Dehalococcoidia bacterium]